MFHPNCSKVATVTVRLALLLLCLSTIWHSPVVMGQTGESLEEMKQKVSVLLEQTRYTEAVPLLEKIVAAEPNESEGHYFLASSLLGVIANTKDEAVKKQLRLRARAEFLKAKQLGNTASNLDAMILSLPADGSGAPSFSENAQADALMNEAEALFSRGELDEAFKAYQKALTLDPKLYHAALFSGDVQLQKGDYAQAELWYSRAIAIDPNKETAYRYSATSSLKQHKYDEARDRYIEAYITEPYNSFTASGLVQWAELTNNQLGHPKIDIPTKVAFDEKGDVKINLDSSALLGSKDDGSFAWIAYGATRSSWHKEKFKQTFPTETSYRHSLAEEADAVRSVISLATADKKTKSLSPSLQKLKKLNDEGLLEAYILLARADEGIVRDHPVYLKNNRDKLRRYVLDYVSKGGGSN
ncbi:MAG: Tetratricopeptide repeat protein [Acidobacteria bacterium]|nr:Tetratricopeptide repeat protein [Acidobacteriota bacterium]